jgi:hypothetical protein
MAGRYGASVVIDRAIDEVFAFLADGYNDKKFSPRVLEIEKTTDGPPWRRDRLCQHRQGRRRQDQARVRVHRVRAADEDPLERALEEHDHRPRGRL